MGSELMFVVGTGGLGSGLFLALHGEHTLGREESRAATLLDRRDAAKLHIVLHYVRRLGGAGTTVLPIGLVGDDPAGRETLEQMRSAGMDVSLVGVLSSRPTLFSVCFQYPDGTGGNITTASSASDSVGPGLIYSARDRLRPGTAVALPEVPLAAREALLDLATEAGLFRVATFVSGEWPAARRLLDRVDLLVLNIDEAVAFTSPEAADVMAAAIDQMGAGSLVVTAGRQGSWAWDGQSLSHAAPLHVEPVNTAGAGDAHLGALIVALGRGLDLAAANRYASIVSSLSVTYPDTIAFALDAATVSAAGGVLPGP
ncbi:carbohydrate kinase family protein [Dactylosporangium sp. NPDC051541]|uniref:carbohydrate kinase family protein n=1 Tax=Dactylosporangium sp. NPDC051541 TaxID=3363977 RepID=UPI0037A734CA